MARIFVAIPTYDRKVDIEIMIGFAQLPGTYPEHEFGIDYISGSLISYSRNYLARRFLESGFEWLYFWDADLVIRDTSFIAKLLETAKNLDAHIVGAPYRLKGPDPLYACGNYGEGGAANLTGIKNFVPADLTVPMLVDTLATGSMLIHRSVIEKLSDPWFTIVDLPEGKVIPEDFNFCAKAHKAGFKIAVDPRIATSHYGYSAWNHYLK